MAAVTRLFAPHHRCSPYRADGRCWLAPFAASGGTTETGDASWPQRPPPRCATRGARRLGWDKRALASSDGEAVELRVRSCRSKLTTSTDGRALSGEGGLAQVEAYSRGDASRTVPRKGALLWLRPMRHVLHRAREGRVCVPRRWHEPHRAAGAQGARQGKGLRQPGRPALRRHRGDVLRHQHTPLLRRTAGTGEPQPTCPPSPHTQCWGGAQLSNARSAVRLGKITNSFLASAGPGPPLSFKNYPEGYRRAHRRLAPMAASSQQALDRLKKAQAMHDRGLLNH